MQGEINDLHDVNLLRAVAVFILHGSVVQSPGVRYPAINAFVRTFQQSDDPKVRRSCIQTASSIFELADHVTAISFVQVTSHAAKLCNCPDNSGKFIIYRIT